MATWLITGCSTGLGRALAEAVAAAGHNVVATARDQAKVADLAGGSDRVLALRRKENAGHVPVKGDPAKAAQAIMRAVASEKPPALLLLGSDAFETYREILQGRLDLAGEWEPVSRSTDFGA